MRQRFKKVAKGLLLDLDTRIYYTRVAGVDGTVKRESTKVKSRSEAERILAMKRENTRLIRRGEAVPMNDVKVSELFEKCLDYYNGRTASGTWSGKRAVFRSFLSFIGQDRHVRSLSLSDIDGFQTHLIVKGTSNSTCNVQVTHITGALRLGARWDIVPAVMIQKLASMKKLKVEDKIPSFLSRQELDHLFKVSTERMKPLIKLLAYTGMRLREAYSLKWSQVNFSLDRITVYQSKTKKHLNIPMIAQAKELLLSLHPSLNPDEKVFGFIGVHQLAIASLVKREFVRAGLGQYSAHVLRHTYASQAAMAGVSIQTISKLLGHSSVEMSMRYAHLSPLHLKESADKIGAFFGEVADKVAYRKAM